MDQLTGRLFLTTYPNVSIRGTYAPILLSSIRSSFLRHLLWFYSCDSRSFWERRPFPQFEKLLSFHMVLFSSNQEYGQFGITCNVICPGAMTDASRSWAATDPESYAASVAHQPIKRLGDPDTDIAPAVLFFASEESRFVTGQTIALDRGSTRF